MNHAKQDYDKMSWLYNALYGNMSREQLMEIDFITKIKPILQLYKAKEIAILDAACGNGIQATALALCGYNVTATDISGEMVKLTAAFARKHNVTITLDVKSWMDLPSAFPSMFDIILCTGNSIVHSTDAIEREKNIASMVQVLSPNGTLVIETRNWDKVLKDKARYSVYSKLHYNDCEYLPLYQWKLSEMEHQAEVGILLQEIHPNNQVMLYENTLHFTPFSHVTLRGAMENLGLKIINDTFIETGDWYQVCGQKV